MKAKRALRIVAISLAVCVVLGSTALGAILWRIHRSVQGCCALAQQSHPKPGDDATALISYMNSGQHTLRERNLAVWTLGRLGNRKALSALEAVYTGELCEHDTFLCQYELEKAIKLCGGTPDPPRKTQH
ncbi:MAG TPA: hypothetical protein VMW24_18060, partial [Sedimentisphaerales bacterium]|nr:hypothetical protein [Sedimentisphaerales bacterium]